MAQLLTVRLNKSDQQPLGFRLQGGKDFGTPLVVQKVNVGSPAERAGLQAGDALIRVNTTDVYTLRHQDAQDAIRAAGPGLELTVQRGGSTWAPSVTPTGSLPRPGSKLGPVSPVTTTSLKATPQPNRNFGSGHNNVAKPFGYTNGNNDPVKSIVNKQYNTPVNMYSDQTIAETLSAQTEVLAGGVLGVNFKKNEKTYDAEKSAVFKVLQEEQNDPEPEVSPVGPGVAGLRHVSAPAPRPDAPINNTGGLPPGQNICEDCERLITGVFVRIKDKNLHVECFKCATCGTSLKNQGYYNLNGKLYCDIHAKLIARQNPPSANLEPVTVPPGGRIPPNSYSTPLPPLSTNNYSNGSSSMFSPSSNLSGPKPFGSSIGSAYSPSLSPRSAPLSPARPVTAPAPAPPFHPAAAYNPAPAFNPAPAYNPAPAPAPAYTPAAAPPFAPTKSVKSVVWPPPNPPEDEPPKIMREREDTQVTNPDTTSGSSIMEAMTNSQSAVQQSVSVQSEQTTETSHEEMHETISKASFSAATSAACTTSTESRVECTQSQEMHTESTTCTMQAFTEQKCESQSITMYQSQTSPPIQNSFINPLETKVIKENTETKTSQESEIVQSVNEIKDVTVTSAELNNKEEVNTEAVCQQSDEVAKDVAVEEKAIPSEQTTTESMLVEKEKTVQTKSENMTVQSTFTQEVEGTTKTENVIRKHSLISDSAQQAITPLPPSNIQNSIPRGFVTTIRDAVTIASDRPYSPLPAPQQPTTYPMEPLPPIQSLPLAPLPPIETELSNPTDNVKIPQQSPMFAQQPKRGITPIPPITPYSPPEQTGTSIPMPPESTPYIPEDFKIIIEPKGRRESNVSPFVEALRTAPERPFTPVSAQPIERKSLKEALTVAPDRAYSPLPLNVFNQSSQVTSTMQTSSVQVQTTSTQILRPIATQTTTQMTEAVHSEFSSMQNMCQLQSSNDMSAFKPVGRQTFPPPQPEDFCQLANFPPISSELKTNFEKSTRMKQETVVSESKSYQSASTVASGVNTQGFSSVKSAQNFFEQLDQRECLSSTAVRSKAGLHKPDNIPSYQKNFDQLLSQRGITPEIYTAPAVLQRPVTPTTEPPIRPRDKSVEPKSVPPPQKSAPPLPQPKIPPQQPPVYFHKDNTPISMTFQPVEEALLRVSPARSRPTTPSLINKPAPIIPYYQMNLVTVEHNQTESNLLDPLSREATRSPTPKPRSRSPAQGPPPNPLKAHAPRIKESTPQLQSAAHNLLTQATSNLRREHEMTQKGLQSNIEVFNASGAKNWAQDQPSVIKEQRHSNIGFKSENYERGNMRVKEDSMMNQNYGQRQMESQNVSEFGNTVVQSTRKTFEEFESSHSAKVIEIRKGGSSSFDHNQIDSNLRPSTINPKQIFPPPIMSVSSSDQNSSVNLSNQRVTTGNNESGYCPPNSGANQTPVCDPTPSTGSNAGAGRGKTFGVSSAPKRGRGVLNKAAMPGSRVPLCASCNGNIRGPFITALGRIWCPEHFTCVNASCRRQLQDIGFVEENGQLYCEYCFEQYIAPACDKCHAKIKGDCLNAIGKHFHPECFACVYCGKLFGNNPFFLEDGLPYCESDWNELFTTKCFACGFPVEAGDRWVEALNNNYHSQCFNCTVCKKNLEGQSFFAKGGRPFCKMHAR